MQCISSSALPFFTATQVLPCRVWFPDPGTADATRFRHSETSEVTMVFTFDLLATELSELNFRVHFTSPTDQPSLDVWPSVKKPTKALLWRAIYQKETIIQGLYTTDPPNHLVSPAICDIIFRTSQTIRMLRQNLLNTRSQRSPGSHGSMREKSLGSSQAVIPRRLPLVSWPV